jgi:hypothetical protein
VSINNFNRRTRSRDVKVSSAIKAERERPRTIASGVPIETRNSTPH